MSNGLTGAFRLRSDVYFSRGAGNVGVQVDDREVVGIPAGLLALGLGAVKDLAGRVTRLEAYVEVLRSK